MRRGFVQLWLFRAGLTFSWTRSQQGELLQSFCHVHSPIIVHVLVVLPSPFTTAELCSHSRVKKLFAVQATLIVRGYKPVGCNTD